MSLQQIGEKIDVKYVVFSVLALAVVIISSAVYGEYRENQAKTERDAYWSPLVNNQVALNNQIIDYANNASIKNALLEMENADLKNIPFDVNKTAENLQILDYYVNKSVEATTKAIDALNVTGDKCISGYGQKVCYNKFVGRMSGGGGGGASVS